MGSDLRERDSPCDVREQRGAVDLYWIPLGAGAYVVRVSSKLFECVSALVQRQTT